MKNQIKEIMELPSGIDCEFSNNVLKFNKGDVELSRIIKVPRLEVKIEGRNLILNCPAGNKNDLKVIKTLVAHIKNVFTGLNDKFVYKLQTANVHFPMALKVEGNKLIINNFLGEKTPRFADILPNVHIDVKGAIITLSSHDKESVGQTAANIEKTTKIKSKDRRVFQDGIYIIEKAGRAI